VTRLRTTLLAVALSAWCGAAHAQALTPQEEANARFQAGLKYYDARDFESARLAFTQAYAVMQKPGILLNLGLSEIYAGRYVEGLDHLDTFLKEPGLSAEKKERAKKGYDEAYRKTGHLNVRTSREAEVQVDGKALAHGATLVHVTPGAHKLEAHLGDKAKSAEVDVAGGVEKPVDLSFDGEAPAAAGTAGVPTGAAGTAGSAATQPPSDASHVEPPKEEPKSTFWDTGRILGVAALAVGVGGVTAGVVFGSSSNSDKDRADALQKQLGTSGCAGSAPPAACADLRDARSSQDSSATLSTVFLVSGAVVGAAGVALLVWPRSHVQVAPSASARDAGLLVWGTF
jgi:hypothetical protein